MNIEQLGNMSNNHKIGGSTLPIMSYAFVQKRYVLLLNSPPAFRLNYLFIYLFID
jgi:hypothetical protein